MSRAGEPKSGKRMFGLTVNRLLYPEAGRHAESLAAEIRVDLEAANAYVERHGSFAEAACQHFAASGDETA